MSPREEISSTERLLQVIRGKKDASVTPENGSSNAVNGPRPKAKSRKVISLEKLTTVGVDFGATDVKMVRMRHLSDREWKLLDFRRFPIPSGVRDNENSFSEFLKGIFADFSVHKKEQIWTAISYIDVEIRHIRIPKVPKKQVINAIYWTAKKESPFDDAATIFDYDIHGEIIENGIPKTAVMVYTASKEKVEERKQLFDRIGFPLTGITVAPFAIQNFFSTQWISTPQQAVATLYIGNDHSRIDIFSEGKLSLTRGIKFGTNSIVEGIAENYNEQKRETRGGNSHEGISLEAIQSEESPAMDLEQARKVLLSITLNSPSLSKEDPGSELTEKELFELMIPAVDRLVRQVERTFEHYTMTYGAAPASKIYVSWMLEAYRPLIEYIGDQLGIERDILDPLDPGHPFVSDAMPPQSLQERTSFNMAIGLALSNNSRTPNAIFTYQEKETEKSIRRINRQIFACFIVVMALCLGGFLWQLRAEDTKSGTINRLRDELRQYGVADQNMVLQMAGQAVKIQKMLKEGSKRYLVIAMISEISQRTPPHIHLLNITADLAGVQDAEKDNTGKNIMIEGIITGEREMLEAALAQYMIRLESSILFSAPAVLKSEMDSRPQLGEGLHFIAKLSLL